MTGSAPAPAPAAPLPHVPHDIRLFWWAGTCDALGSQTSGLVLPLLLLTLGRSATEVDALAGLSAAATLLLGPLAAVPADRGARKQMMVGSALVSAAAMAGVTVAVAAGPVPLAVLIAAVLVERCATSCYEAAALGTVALVCPPVEHRRVLSRLQAGERGALVLGPALGGLLFHAERWLPFLADALSYAVAAGCICAMRSPLAPHREQRPSAGTVHRGRQALAAEAGAGLALIRREPFLRLALLWISAVNALLVALYYTTVFALQNHGRGAAPLGLVLALAGAAGLAGALAAPRIAGRRSAGRVLVTVSWLMVPPAAALAVARHLPRRGRAGFRGMEIHESRRSVRRASPTARGICSTGRRCHGEKRGTGTWAKADSRVSSCRRFGRGTPRRCGPCWNGARIRTRWTRTGCRCCAWPWRRTTSRSPKR
ncbi:MFS transporter [Streptomyces inhibens]|uniref:MFS transporter n=1 Tax=Streptomyces inhibens TaxID=2293571 RepID=UPI001EE765AE|nr:MFS transporter [Streptomyces inhibens]UKY54599.1 MFS transporter [Streptomyces inhibens]